MSNDGVDLEEDYFAREDRKKLEALKQQSEEEKAAQARADQKALHHLHCGKCGASMNTQTFKGVEIEVCPDGGAVLLDSGELETLAGEDEGGALATLAELFSFSKTQRS